MRKVMLSVDRESYLKSLISEKGYNLKEFAQKINMPYTTLRSILNDSVGGAAVDNIIKICTGLDISIEEMQERSGNSIGMVLTSIEKNMLKIFRSLNAEGQEKAIEYLVDLIESGRYKKDNQSGLAKEA